MSNTQNVTANLIEQAELLRIKPVEDINLETALHAAVDPVIEDAAQELMPVQKTDEQLNAEIDAEATMLSTAALVEQVADNPVVIELLKKNNQQIDIQIGTSRIKNPG